MGLLAQLSAELPEAQQADERQLQDFMRQTNKTLLEASVSLREQQSQVGSLKAAIAKAVARRKELEAEQKRAAERLLEVQTTLSAAKLDNERDSSSRTKRLQALREDAKVVSLALDGVLPRQQPVSSLLQATRTLERVVEEDRDPSGVAADVRGDRAFTLRKAAAKIRAAIALGGAVLRPSQNQLMASLPGEGAAQFLQLRSEKKPKDPMEPLAETLAQVKRETTSEIRSTEETQKKTKETFEEVSKVLNEQIEARKKAVEALDAQMHELDEEASKDKVELQLVERKAQASKTTVDEIQSLQKRRDAEFRTRTRSRGRELKALTEATRILSGRNASSSKEAPPSFLQIRAKGAGQAAATAQDITAGVSSGDQFEAVRRMVEDLLRQLQDRQAQDMRRDGWCGAELKSTSGRVASKAAAFEELETRRTSVLSEYEAQVAEAQRLREQLQALRAEAEEAEERRRLDKARALADQANYEESRRMVHEALSVLRKVYTDSTGGKGVVGLLEFSAQSYADLRAEAEKAEEEAVIDYKQSKDSREVQEAQFKADLRYKRQRSAKLSLQLKSMKKELEEAGVQLAALKKYLQEVQADCRIQPEGFDTRKAKRDEQIKMLKDAQDILQERDA